MVDIPPTPYNDFAPATPTDGDILLAMRAAGGVNYNVLDFLHKDATGNFSTKGASIVTGDDTHAGVFSAGSGFDNGGGAVVVRGKADAFDPGTVVFYAGVSPGGGSVERMRIGANGNIGIGTPNTDAGRVVIAAGGVNGVYVDSPGVASSLVCTKDSTAGGFAIFYFGSTGVGSISTNGTATSYNTSSDYRLKEDLKPVADALTRVRAIPVYNFAWKATGERADGFLAHEFGDHIPGACAGEKDATRLVKWTDLTTGKKRQRTEIVPQGIDQSKAVPLLMAALQDLAGFADALAARIAALEAA